MTNALAMKIGGFTALISTAVLGSATGAYATTVDGCGTKPAGGTLKNKSGVCELTFKSAGSYAWILPAGIADLQAIIVGAGGGAAYVQTDIGYSGAGGDVVFVDLTDRRANDAAEILIGAGGVTGTPIGYDGQDSYLRMNGGDTLTVDGGTAGSTTDWAWGFCDGGYFGENLGAGTTTVGQDSGPCVGGGPGIIPDSHSDAPAIFDGFTTELGHGGGVYIDSTHTQRIGEGANVFYDSVNDVTSADLTGADGAVIFRYTSTQSLAETGNGMPVGEIALASLAAIAAGLAASAFGRRAAKSLR